MCRLFRVDLFLLYPRSLDRQQGIRGELGVVFNLLLKLLEGGGINSASWEAGGREELR